MSDFFVAQLNCEKFRIPRKA